jgi:hypothetical protein
MSKFCEKCGKEIPQSSKKDLCESCQNKTYGKARKFVDGAKWVVFTVAVPAITILISKGKFGGPKS